MCVCVCHCLVGGRGLEGGGEVCVHRSGTGVFPPSSHLHRVSNRPSLSPRGKHETLLKGLPSHHRLALCLQKTAFHPSIHPSIQPPSLSLSLFLSLHSGTGDKSSEDQHLNHRNHEFYRLLQQFLSEDVWRGPPPLRSHLCQQQPLSIVLWVPLRSSPHLWLSIVHAVL